MTEQRPLSLTEAIIINVNIMLGIGIFVNTVELAKRTGALGGFAYLIVGFLMLPLVISLAKLTNLHPDGGFYTFGKKEISTFAGFISAWGFLLGKLSSGAFMIHIALSLIQQLIPILQSINIFILDTIVIICFVLLNMLAMKSGGRIQAGFTILKLVPIAFAIFIGLFLFSGSNISEVHIVWSGIPLAIPLLFYAMLGFESACLLSNKIENPEKNAPKAILISYITVLVIATLFQFILYGTLGSTLAEQSNYLYAFPEFLKKLLPTSPIAISYLKVILHLAIASSALGGSYGIMFSNAWNLYILALNNHTFFPKLFTKFNRHAIPAFCVIIEGLLYLVYLFVSGGNQLAMQPLSVFGVVIGYTISVIALLKATITRSDVAIQLWIPIIALITCVILTTACILSLIQVNVSAFITFSILVTLGCVMFFSSLTKN